MLEAMYQTEQDPDYGMWGICASFKKFIQHFPVPDLL